MWAVEENAIALKTITSSSSSLLYIVRKGKRKAEVEDKPNIRNVDPTTQDWYSDELLDLGSKINDEREERSNPLTWRCAQNLCYIFSEHLHFSLHVICAILASRDLHCQAKLLQLIG